MATLVITDSADGTGCTATIAAGGASDTNTLFRCEFPPALGTLTMTSSWSRVGNGDISVSVGVGWYLWLLENVTTGGTKTNTLVYQNTTDATSTGDPVMYRVLTAVKNQIVALNLTGISSTSVVVKWLPRQFDGTTDPVPGITITPAPIPESAPDDLNSTDKVGYPVLVTMIDAQNQSFAGNLSRNLKWRELIMREFRHQALSGVTEIQMCDVEPRTIIDPSAFIKNKWNSSLVLRFHSRETRGN